MSPTFDERDGELRAERLAAWNNREGPRVGDFLTLPDGKERRLAENWGDGFQVSHNEYGGSFYLAAGGLVSYSGGYESEIYPCVDMEDTGETKPGAFWFFHHNDRRAHNGVYFTAPARVFRMKAKS